MRQMYQIREVCATRPTLGFGACLGVGLALITGDIIVWMDGGGTGEGGIGDFSFEPGLWRFFPAEEFWSCRFRCAALCSGTRPQPVTDSLSR